MPDPQQMTGSIADRIERDEDFAMRVGEDPRAALEAEGLPDSVIAAVLEAADVDVVGFAMPPESVAGQVERIMDALRSVRWT